MIHLLEAEDLTRLVAVSFNTAAEADVMPLTGLGQLGAVGAVLAIFFWFGYKVYSREVARADANEAEIKRLNTIIQDKYVPSLEEASIALRETNDILRDQRRGS